MTAQTATESKAVLRLDGVTKAYGTNLILDHISFDVHEHEVVALLGPSGSGKSTLMKCVNLLERVNDGQIWLGDTDITDPRENENAIRSRIGVVFQQFNLFPHMTVIENIILASTHVLKRDKAESVEKATELLERIGMADKANSYPDRLSGGQQQRMELKQQGTTILMATHEMSFAHQAADRIVLLRDGHIIEDGTPRKVMEESTNPQTQEFFSYFRNL